MAAYAKEKMFYISVGFWLILGVECFSGWSNRVLTIKTGGSVTIPCHYDETNPPQKKYWHSDIALSNIYTNTTEENLSVIDHPDQSLFTVTMRNLQNKHTGVYFCVLETEGQPTVTYDLHLKVQPAPDVSVVSSSVSGHEGGNVSVQCFYTSEYQNNHKQWCRYKDQSCYRVGRTDTSQNPSVQISDDGRSSFTVLMTGLRLSDSGWYYCSVGDLQVPVQLIVNESKCAVTSIPTAPSSVSSSDGVIFDHFAVKRFTTQPSANRNSTTVMTTDSRPETHRQYEILLISAVAMLVLLLLVSLAVMVTWRLRKKPKRGHIREEEHFNSTSNTTPSENQMTSSSSAATSSASVADNSVTYSSVIFHKLHSRVDS